MNVSSVFELIQTKAPASVQLELTRHCNLNCFYCTIRNNDSVPPSQFSLRQFTSIIDKLAGAEVFEVAFFGGEPFLYPHIYELGRYSSGKGLTTNLLSNGTLIRTENIGRIAEVFHSGTLALNGLEASHDRFVGRPGAFKQTSRALKEFPAIGFPIGIDTLVSASNVSQLESFLQRISEDLPNVSSIFLDLYVVRNGAEFQSEKLEQSQLGYVYETINKYNATKELQDKVSFGTAFPYCLLPEKYANLRRNCSAGWTFGSFPTGRH